MLLIKKIVTFIILQEREKKLITLLISAKIAHKSGLHYKSYQAKVVINKSMKVKFSFSVKADD